MERVLLTGARTAIALELTRLLHRAGHEVFVAETFPRYVTAYSNCVEKALAVPAPRFEPDRFIERLASLIREHRIAFLVPTGEEALWVARGRARLAEICRVFCDRAEVLDALQDKLRFQQLASAVGPTLHTWPLESAAQLTELRRLHGHLVLKRVYSRFGQGVLIPGEDTPIPPGSWLVQQFMPGREICSFAIAHAGVVAAHVAYVPRFRIPLGPSFFFEPILHEGAEQWVRAFVARYAYTGSIAFDFIEASGGALFPLECNPRMTSGIHLLPPDKSAADALLGRGAVATVSPQPAMWSLAMIAIALRQVRSTPALATWWRAFRSARDVFWDPDDPRPAVHILSSRGHLRALARKHGLSLAQAATYYTEWDGTEAQCGLD